MRFLNSSLVAAELATASSCIAALSTTLSFAVLTSAGEVSPFASSANCRNALQMYSKLAASGSSEFL